MFVHRFSFQFIVCILLIPVASFATKIHRPATRKPASKPTAQSKIKPQKKTGAQSPELRGPTEEARIHQQVDAGGHVLSEVLATANYSEFTTDPNGSGVHEIWEASEPGKGITFRATTPIGGRFQIVEIDKKRDGGLLHLHYDYNSARQIFEMTEASFKPDHPMFSNFAVFDKKDASGKFILTCDENNGVYKDINAWVDIMKKISNGNAEKSRALMSCYLKRYQSAFFDPNCTSGAFASSFDDMQKGIVEVMGSTYPTDGKSTYLQCLTKQGFSTHAARIEALVANLSLSLMDVMKNDSDMAAAGNDPAKILALCDKPYNVARLAGRSVVPIACDENVSEEEMAEYRPGDGGRDQIIFHRTSADITSNAGLAKDFGLPATKVSNVFASYFFHESLHQSGIDDETVVYGIQNCCDGRPGDHSGDCAKAQKIAADLQMAPAYEKSFSKAFSGFDLLREQIDTTFGTDNEKVMMRAYYGGFDSHKATAEQIYKTCAAKHTTCDQACDDECSKVYLNQMAKFTQDWFNDPNYCAHYHKQAQDPGGMSCEQIGTQLSALIAKQANNTVARAPEAAHQNVEQITGKSATVGSLSVLTPSGAVQIFTGQANDTTPSAGAISDATRSAPPTTPQPVTRVTTAPVPTAVAPSPTANSPTRPTASVPSPSFPLPARPTAAPTASAPSPILGQASAARADAGARVQRGRDVLAGADRIASNFIPRAIASTGSARRLNTESGAPTQYNPSSSPPLSLDTSALGVSRIRSDAQGAATTQATANQATASSNSGSLVRAAVADAPAARGDVTNQQKATTDKKGAREQADANANAKHAPEPPPSNGINYSNGGPVLGANSIAPAASGADGVDFSTKGKVRTLVTGDYIRVHGLLTGAHAAEFEATLKADKINVTDHVQHHYGSRETTEVYLYCPKTRSLVLKGSCQ